MTTKNIVPRADGEGELGTSSKKWDKVQARTGSFDHIQTTTMATEIYTSGSTKFGDTSDDTHQFTGSVLVDGDLTATTLYGDGSNLSGISAENFDTTATAGQTNLPLVMVVSPGGADSEPKTDADIFFNSATNTLAVPNVSSSVNISASAFYGDGQYLDNISSEWDGTRNGDAEITGSLTVTGSGATLRVDVDSVDIDSVNNVRIDSSTGGITLDSATQGVNIDAGLRVQINTTNTLNGIQIGLANSGVPVDIGNTTDSTVTIGDKMLVNTNITASGHVSASAFYGDGQYLDNISADWDGTHNGDAEITGSLTVSGQIYNSGEDNGTKTANFTIDWNNGMTQEVILSGSTATTLTASFSNVEPYATYQLIHKIGKDNMAIYFSDSIYWPGGTRPTLSTTSGSIDVLTFTTDGNSNLYGVAQYNFSASVG